MADLRIAIASLLLVCGNASAGTATLTWVVPVTNDDGTALADLASQRVDYGQTDLGPYPNSVTVAANATSATVGSLATGTWYFVVVSLDSAGQVSRTSAQQSKVVP